MTVLVRHTIVCARATLMKTVKGIPTRFKDLSGVQRPSVAAYAVIANDWVIGGSASNKLVGLMYSLSYVSPSNNGYERSFT